ncbi:MAG: hypothetical protein CMH53_02280, partial [Myxococcales bacterium]|nr:hypothetical protein [Myxococcales bacterium]
DGVRRANRAMPTLLAQQSLASDIADNDNALLSAQSDHKVALAAQAELKERHGQLAEQRRKRIEMDKHCDALTRRQDRLVRRQGLVETLKSASQELQDCGERHKLANMTLSKIQKELDELQSVQQQRDELAPQVDQARAKLTAVQKLNDAVGLIETFYDQIQPTYQATEQSDATKKGTHQQRIVEAEMQVGSERNRRAALSLAEQLQDNQPCPVCGSVEHPHLAVADGQSAEQLSRLEALEQHLQARREALVEFERACAALKGTYTLQLKQAEASVELLNQSGFNSPDQWRQVLAQHNASLSELERKAADLSVLLQRRARTMTAHREAKAALQSAQAARYQAQAVHVHKQTQLDELQAADEKIEDLDAAELQLRQQLQSLKAELTVLDAHIKQTDSQWQACQATLAAANSQLADAKRRAKELLERFEKATTALNQALLEHQFADPDALRSAGCSPEREQRLDSQVRDWTQDVHRVQSRLEELNGHIGQQNQPDMSALEQTLAVANNQDTAATTAHALAQEQLGRFDKNRVAYDAAYAEVARRVAGLKGLLVLSEQLNADNSRNLTFSDWILGWWLERVLDSANIRLMRLSEDRYRLRRRWDVSDRRSRAGLDLDVMDAHTGDPRDVRTLSGGEKFLASISLALGLADVIQSHSGGMEMDTLFIDEGFGSLSDEYRDQVLQVLDELRGTRQVGLITHVADVKSFIPCQLQVSTSASGSTIDVVN